jgi:hypothetical protein
MEGDEKVALGRTMVALSNNGFEPRLDANTSKTKKLPHRMHSFNALFCSSLPLTLWLHSKGRK